MKILLDIPDKQVPFAMEVLRSFSFVKKIKPMSEASETLWNDLQDAAKQVRQHKKGKLKLKTAEDLLNEL
ncbi:MAG: hypothetical protein EAZ47_08400 [Bacteroidetes bacterium]|nr:MAG: hypothetical protein EAY72_01950 [Bacteroidota bacterium]TAF92605.1 MAG: hypothetical protein EAZ47_08400 [Bacteroidota bacterium]